MAFVDVDLAEQRELVADRVEFIELLDEEGPLATRDIVEALEHSRSTVTRALRALREADLIEKTDEGYSATVPAVLAAAQYRRYTTASDAILASKDLLAPLSDHQAPPVDLLINADTIHTEAEIPVRPLKAISDRVRDADDVRAYFPTLVNTHLLRAWRHAAVDSDFEGELIIDPDLLTVLKGQYPQLLAEIATSQAFSAFSTEGPPYAVVLTTTGGTTTAAVVIYENGATVRGVVINDAPTAVDWARDELEQLQSEATDVTADLESLGAAVADETRTRREAGTAPRSSAEGDDAEEVVSHSLPIALKEEGFVSLSEEYFSTHRQAAPEVSWRTGFTLADVRAGHAVDRLTEDGGNLTEKLVGRLRAGDGHVLLGPPGSGKSTICMAVACAWYEQGVGPVLYRERGSGSHFESVAVLEAYLRQIPGHALVVVEDAVREQASAIFTTMQALDSAEDVTFLLDSRTQEWQNADDIYIDARRDAYRRSAIDRVTVPKLDERECQRFVDHFSSLVTEVDVTGAELFSLIEEGAEMDDTEGLSAGSALIAQYYLSRRYDPSTADDGRPSTALDEAVRRTLQSLSDHESRFALDVALLVSVLNAAGIPVAKEYLYAIAPTEEYAAVDAALSRLEGRMLFEADQRGVNAESPTAYRTRHETWSIRFMQQFQEQTPTKQARDRFGHCLTRLLSLADNSAQRRRIQHHLGGRTPHLHRIEVDPENWADEILERVYSVGQTASNLAPLFGETSDGPIELPEACSRWMTVQTAYWSGQMNRIYGDFSRAEREFQRVCDRAEAVDVSNEAVPLPAVTKTARDREAHSEIGETARICWRALGLTELGAIARESGNFTLAAEHFEEALALFREIDDPYGEASVIRNLGNVAYKRGEIANAEERYEESLAIFRELEDSHGEAMLLTNLGAVAHGRGELRTAEESYRESLERYQELGDRYRAATTLRNLGMVARQRDELQAATEHLTESLTICRELGDRHGEAVALSHLGVVAQQRGELAVAADNLRTSLALFREIGDRQDEAHALEYLGDVLRDRGDMEAAKTHLNECLNICQEIGDPHGEATSLFKLGTIARDQGNLERASTYLEQAADIAVTTNVGEAPDVLGQVVDIHEQRGDVDTAVDWCQRAIDFAEQTDRPELKREFATRRRELRERIKK